MNHPLAACLCAWMLAACSPAGGDGPSTAAPRASEPVAAAADLVITDETVYDHEEAWPAIVAMTKAWQPPGPGPGASSPLVPPVQGALIRVEPDRRVRIDFGRHGKHDIPFEYTDLVERANRTRRGELAKQAPNFLLQIGTRLVDSSMSEPRPVDLRELLEAEAFLCIFADPRGRDFAVFAKQLAAFEGENGVRTVFFPQSVVREDTEFLRERLGALFWPVPFAYPRAAPSYTRQLLGELPEAPYALLVSPHGKVLYRSALTEAQAMARLGEAVRA